MSGVRSPLLLLLVAAWPLRSAFPQPPTKIDVAPDVAIRARLGQPSPDFKLKTLADTMIALSTLKGRPVVINFWASWCPPCRQEMPLLIAAYREHREQGLEVVAVHLTDQEYAKDIRSFAAEFALPFPVALDQKGKIRGKYGLIALPTTVFVGSDGTVRVVNSGPIDGAVLARHLSAILSPR